MNLSPEMLLGLLAVAYGIIGWFIVDKVKRIETDVAEALKLAREEKLAYKVGTRLEVATKEIVQLVHEVDEKFQKLISTERENEQHLRHNLRGDVDVVAGALNIRILEAERRIAALQAYLDALERRDT